MSVTCVVSQTQVRFPSKHPRLTLSRGKICYVEENVSEPGDNVDDPRCEVSSEEDSE